MSTRALTASSAFGALLHPTSLAAIAILLANDHALKQAAPSLLTGKLSDFAGLYFAPLVALVALGSVLAVATPGLSARTAALPTYIAIGALFAALKTSTAARDAFVWLIGLSGMRISLVVDPTDLVALLSLPLSYAMWSSRLRDTQRTTRRPLRRTAILAVAAIAIAATSAARPIVTSVAVDPTDGDLLYAVVESTGDNDGLYVSSRGGLGWIRISTMTGAVMADPLRARTAYILDATESDSGLLRLKVGSRPMEIGPGRPGQGSYDVLRSSFITVGPWPEPVLYYVFRGNLWLTEDDGVRWRNVDLDESVYALAPTATPGLLYAATHGYVLRSVDSGKSWTHVAVLPGNGDVTSLAAHGEDSRLLLAGIGKEIQRSTDGGATWTSTIRYGGSTRLENAHWAVVFDPRDPDRAYALFGRGCCAPLFSIDRGRTWKEWGEPLASLSATADADHPLVAVTPSFAGVMRHVGVVPGTWESVGEKLPLKN